MKAAIDYHLPVRINTMPASSPLKKTTYEKYF